MKKFFNKTLKLELKSAELSNYLLVQHVELWYCELHKRLAARQPQRFVVHFVLRMQNNL